MAHYSLLLKNTESVVDTIESNSFEDARAFYIARKQMDEKTFDNLYHVEENPQNK